jgi:hypothetical protein
LRINSTHAKTIISLKKTISFKFSQNFIHALKTPTVELKIDCNYIQVKYSVHLSRYTHSKLLVTFSNNVLRPHPPNQNFGVRLLRQKFK